MNRFFTLLLAASCLTAVGQCDEIFISEYIEGLANNKALEIYNPTDVAVDLSDYRLERYVNGFTTAEDNQKVDLSGTLEANSVVVIALDKRDPNGVDFESPVWDGLLDAADLWLCPIYEVNNTMYYNGNDAVVLRKISTNTAVDIFGKIGEDPGSTGWAEMTQNHTLIRKPNVTVGDTDALDDFLVVDQWDGTLWSNDSLNYTLDEVFVNLGVHTCECGNAVNCPEDEDEDGICDDVDDCIGEYDECGICNGSGGVYACGCEGIPEGNCDCQGNQLDALGVCGGDCAEDADADGICDDVDDCVGALDACGICNGPGDIYECGCNELICSNPGFDALYGALYGDDGVLFSSSCPGLLTEMAANGTIFQSYNGCEIANGFWYWDGCSCTVVFDFGQPITSCEEFLIAAESSCNCTDSSACNYSTFGDCEYYDECGICGGSGIQEGDCDCDGNQLDAVGVCGGDCLADENGNGICDNSEVYGCTYELGENYASEATYDDGSCIFPCEGVVNTNVFDWDGDYVVTVTDFLMMLSVYGDTDVDLDGVWDSGDDCVDTNACNYANDPSEPCAYIDVLGVCGGGCEGDEDNDGICDDIDTCIGVEDECGVCNGPGPTEVVIDDITILYDSVYAENIDTWFVYEIGQDTTFSYTCAPFFGGCGDPVGYQGYDYATVLIGDQCWFAENLRSANYENGDAIPELLSDSEWSSTTSGAVAVYGEEEGCNSDYSPDIDACDPAQSLEEYGRLYNWYAVDDARGLCPSGWHVPTDGEWMTMEMALGMSEAEANDTGFRGTNQGTQMKTTYGWYNGGNGTNSSGFSGLSGGYRYSKGGFNGAGGNGYWWSSSPNGSNAWYRYLYYDSENVYRNYFNQRLGFSVRCVRDAE